LIIPPRKKDIYNGGEIGYDEENSPLRATVLSINKEEEGLQVRIVDYSYLTIQRGRA
jgi:hypothetical protein